MMPAGAKRIGCFRSSDSTGTSICESHFPAPHIPALLCNHVHNYVANPAGRPAPAAHGLDSMHKGPIRNVST